MNNEAGKEGRDLEDWMEAEAAIGRQSRQVIT
jgi:hypothetical protein